jgi:surface polysaccharide O-acyltransferase-like enzyme
VIGISIATYVPLAVLIGPLEWIGIGPFNAQAGRILLYLVYFLTGTVIGVCGLDHSTFRSDGPIARRWWMWLAVGLMSFIVFIIMIMIVSPGDRTIVSEIAFAVCCGATVFGMIGLFLRFAKRRVRIFDSLSDNAYGIYIVHYVFVTWLQYLLLGSALAPGVKGIVVFLWTLILSWGVVAALRRIPAVVKVI